MTLRNKFLSATLLLCCIMTAVSCSNSGAPIPRRHAYPRIDTYPAEYHAVGNTRPIILKNNSAIITTDSISEAGAHWLTISYPNYNADLYLTISRCRSQKEFEEIQDNRVTRISLNIGGNSYEQTGIESPEGFSGNIFTVIGESATPLMFMCTDGGKCIVSGIFYLKDGRAAESPDSIAPIVDAVRRDVIHLTANLTEP